MAQTQQLRIIKLAYRALEPATPMPRALKVFPQIWNS
jgi:hypothetical protein